MLTRFENLNNFVRPELPYIQLDERVSLFRSGHFCFMERLCKCGEPSEVKNQFICRKCYNLKCLTRRQKNKAQFTYAKVENLENEFWASVLELPKCYLISSQGRVKITTERLIDGVWKPINNERFAFERTTPYGYKSITVRINSKIRKHFFVHRMVALAFIPNPENKPCVNHINGIKTDNRIENLEWVTYLENNHHAIKNGLINQRGHKNCNAIFSPDQIEEIRNRKESGAAIARELGVSKSTICRIKRKDSYQP